MCYERRRNFFVIAVMYKNTLLCFFLKNNIMRFFSRLLAAFPQYCDSIMGFGYCYIPSCDTDIVHSIFHFITLPHCFFPSIGPWYFLGGWGWNDGVTGSLIDGLVKFTDGSDDGSTVKITLRTDQLMITVWCGLKKWRTDHEGRWPGPLTDHGLAIFSKMRTTGHTCHHYIDSNHSSSFWIKTNRKSQSQGECQFKCYFK